MLHPDYLSDLGQWLSSVSTELQSLLRQASETDDYETLRGRARLFIEELVQKKREINLNIQEIRQQYDSEQPSKGFFSKHTRKDIDNDRDRVTLPWKKSIVVLDKQIVGMKTLLHGLDQES